ncbi:MFS general substrate transporter [Phanerochaete sordida]|uniref:MFS general substrate transporter n=1 Tax=Phanerochaete sordida TaxID=48140 RepID=A0A9P3G7Q4_9APHY|nr:MFS general substrate transporter [Phanerochaete sordida]
MVVKHHGSTSSYDSNASDETLLNDEEQPFLHEDLEDAIKLESRTRPTRSHGVTPLPMAQLATLCIVRLVDPIMFTQIFPYVNEMIDHLHLTEDPSKTGLYSGIVESSFAIAQLFTIYQWARLSDRIGRKPVILIGITGIATGTIMMGLSSSLWGVIFARSLAGFFSGNSAVVQSVIGEITDHTNQAVAFPIYGLCWPLGAIIGPLIGGTFANPADKWPQWFGNEFWRSYPYLLPAVMAASLAMCGAVFGFFALEETHPSKRRARADSLASSPIDGYQEKPQQPASIGSLLSNPLIRALSFSGGALSFTNTAFDVIFVLYCYTPIRTGGIAFTAAEIGFALASSGLIAAGLQVFFMPYLLRRFDHAKMYNTCVGIFPWVFLLLPLLNLVARRGAVLGADGVESVTPATKAALWAGIALLLALARSAALAFSVNMILIKNSAPDPASLGVTNGLILFAMCGARAFGPAFASSLFAFSVGFAWWPLRYVWVVVMVGLAALATTLSRRIADGMRAHALQQHPRPS